MIQGPDVPGGKRSTDLPWGPSVQTSSRTSAGPVAAMDTHSPGRRSRHRPGTDADRAQPEVSCSTAPEAVLQLDRRIVEHLKPALVPEQAAGIIATTASHFAPDFTRRACRHLMIRSRYAAHSATSTDDAVLGAGSSHTSLATSNTSLLSRASLAIESASARISCHRERECAQLGVALRHQIGIDVIGHFAPASSSARHQQSSHKCGRSSEAP
jgi:hypothetical protein